MDKLAESNTESVAPRTRSNEGNEENGQITKQNGGTVVKERSKPRYKFDAEGHVHTLDGQPLIGTSTAVQVLSKPLTWWAAGMALAPLGWLNVKKSTAAERELSASKALRELSVLIPKAYAKKLEECYRAHHARKEAAAVTGSDMHAALQSYVETCIYDNHGEPVEPQGLDDHAAVITFAEWAVANVREFLWSEAHCYSERLWTGGICDCGAILKTENFLAIIDFKSSREAYFSHFVQAGGYALQIRENGLWRADGVPVSTAIRHVNVGALMVFPFGGNCEPGIKRNVAGYSAAFEAAVTLHKLQCLFEDGADFAPVRNLSGAVRAEPLLLAAPLKRETAEAGTDGKIDLPAQNVLAADEPIGATAALAEIQRRNQ